MTRIFCCLVFAAAAFAQTAQVTGRVADPSGAVVPGATVAIANIDTGLHSSAVSNAQGYYTVPLLEPGNYQVRVEAKGFRPLVRSGIRLQVEQTARLDFALEVGQVTETIEVAGSAPLVDSETSALGQVVNNKSIVEMPLNGRNAWHLVELTGATVFLRGIGDAGEIPVASMAGGRSFSQTLWVDGGSVQKSGTQRAMAELAPMVDSVEEFKVVTNNYAAEYGRSVGGVFTAITKSGTNQFHGSVFEFLRNDAFDARSFFAKTKAPLRYNQFGGTLGGPVKKDKTHFFYGFEGTKTSTGATLLLTFPNSARRRGDFSGLVNAAGRALPLYNPFTTRPNPQNATLQIRDPFPANQIPASLFDPVAVKAITYYPEPNQAGTIAGANNFNANISNARTQWHHTARVDHSIGEKDRVFARYLAQDNFAPQSNAFAEAAAYGAGGNTRTVSNLAQTLMGTWIRTLSPTLINEVRVNWLRQGRSIFHASAGGDWPSKLGLKGVSEESFPIFRPQSYTLLGAPNPFREQRGPTYQIMDTLTWIHGRHNVKAGFEYRWSGSSDEFDQMPSGDISFNQQGTGLQGNTLSGDGFASMLLGFASQGVVRDSIVFRNYTRYFGGYLQDDWKVTTRLTLNLGIRYDVEPAPVSPENTWNAFNPATINPVARVPGVIRFSGVDGEPRNIFDTDYNNVSPRFGFAWRPSGGDATVVRGGYGIFFGNPNDIGYEQNGHSGFATQVLLVSPDQNQTPALLLKQGFPPFAPPGPQDRTASFGIGSAIEWFQRERASPYSHQFNLGMQRQITGVLAELQYIGNIGRKLTSSHISMNQVRPELLGGAGTIQSRRPFPQYTDVTLLAPNFGASSYHGVLFRAEKRYHNGLQFLFNYTFSKFLDNVDSIANGDFGGTPGTGYQDFYNRRLDKSLSPNDITHNAVFSVIWDAPLGKGRRWLTSGIASQILGGWQLSALGKLQSGPVYGVSTQTNTCECFSSGPQRPDLLRDPELPGGERSSERWFNTAAFAQPGRFQFGTAGRAVGRAPGLKNFDLGLMKNFPIRERIRVQFRGELFNAFNHPYFGLPGTAFGSTTFGIIDNAGDGRIVQFGVKIYF